MSSQGEPSWKMTRMEIKIATRGQLKPKRPSLTYAVEKILRAAKAL
jgi:hypothetical protein